MDISSKIHKMTLSYQDGEVVVRDGVGLMFIRHSPKKKDGKRPWNIALVIRGNIDQVAFDDYIGKDLHHHLHPHSEHKGTVEYEDGKEWGLKELLLRGTV